MSSQPPTQGQDVAPENVTPSPSLPSSTLTPHSSTFGPFTTPSPAVASPPALRPQGEFFMAGIAPVPAQPEEDCPICTDSLAHDSVQIIACRHTFHTNCLHSWLRSGGARNRTCPCCRRELFLAPAAPQLATNSAHHFDIPSTELRLEQIRSTVNTLRTRQLALEAERLAAANRLNRPPRVRASAERLARHYAREAAPSPPPPGFGMGRYMMEGAEVQQAHVRARATDLEGDVGRILSDFYAEHGSTISQLRARYSDRPHPFVEPPREIHRDMLSWPSESGTEAPQSQAGRNRRRGLIDARDALRRVARQQHPAGGNSRRQNQPPS